MRPPKLVLRCYAEKQGHDWFAICLDLNIAAQAESFDRAREKLHAMLCEYVHDAVVGEDKAHARQLLRRRAPVYFWLKYYRAGILGRLMHIKRNVGRLFDETMPLTPSCHHH
jgi:hypothetical protein